MNLPKIRILLVEDDISLQEVLADELREKGYEVIAHSEIPDSKTLPVIDWALLDLRIGGDSSLSLVKDLKDKYPDLKIILMSGFGSVASAVKAIQLGASNFITKPVTVEMILSAFLNENYGEEIPEEDISLARMEREYIDYIIQSSDGNITQAAKRLGLHRQSLQRKLRKYVPK